MNPPKTEGTVANDACPCCGARIYEPRTTAKDLAIRTLCSILLLAIAIPVAWAIEQWMEREGQKVVTHMMIWRDPIESWNSLVVLYYPIAELVKFMLTQDQSAIG
jgi:hypothetical protein